MEALKANGLSPRRVITWRKNNAVPINRAYMPMSANEYIIVGVKKGKNTVFNANVKLVEQTLDEKIVEATIVADKVSTIVYTKVREKIVNHNSTAPLSADEHIALVESLTAETLKNNEKEILSKIRAMYKEDSEYGKYLQACVPNYVQNPLKVGNRIHPTKKPVPLLQYLISLYTEEGEAPA